MHKIKNGPVWTVARSLPHAVTGLPGVGNHWRIAILPFIAGELGKQFMDLGASDRKPAEKE